MLPTSMIKQATPKKWEQRNIWDDVAFHYMTQHWESAPDLSLEMEKYDFIYRNRRSF